MWFSNCELHLEASIIKLDLNDDDTNGITLHSLNSFAQSLILSLQGSLRLYVKSRGYVFCLLDIETLHETRMHSSYLKDF